MLARCVGVNYAIADRAFLASESSRGQSLHQKFANAHDVLASSCALNPEMRAIAAADSAFIRGWSLSPNTANAHDKFDSSCGLNVLSYEKVRMALEAIAGSRVLALIRSVENDHAVLDNSCA